ncbi:MAG: CxxxxCH/CxxCH domain-containing protein [Oscillospiraceae bacterium]|nr:CxxxxCH/CxxCH domain-containing protein [Oscillospiraceae bacterium]
MGTYCHSSGSMINCPFSYVPPWPGSITNAPGPEIGKSSVSSLCVSPVSPLITCALSPVNSIKYCRIVACSCADMVFTLT